MSLTFVLTDISSNVTMGVSGELLTETYAALTGDATAVFQISVDDAKAVFKFKTDSVNIGVDDPLMVFFVDPTVAGLDVLSNAGNATVTVGYAANSDANGSFAASEMGVKYDYIRYLADGLFGTTFGTELFSNADAIRGSLNTILGSTGVGHSGYVVNTALANVANTNSAAPMVAYDGGAETTYGMPSSEQGADNISRELFMQMIGHAPTRFNDISDTIAPQSLPFINGDCIEYMVTINAAANQHLLTGANPIAARNYVIRLNIVTSASNTAPADSVVA